MFELIPLIKAAGYIGIFGIVFAESGLFVGFFLPGDSLLFTAGFLASQGFLHIAALSAVCFAGAVLGDSFGYAFGRKVGPMIFKKEDSLLFQKDHLLRAEQYYNRYGAKTIILARFMPIVRTFAPILAGVGRMRYGEFLAFNVVGGALWAFEKHPNGSYVPTTTVEAGEDARELIEELSEVLTNHPDVQEVYTNARGYENSGD